MARRSPKPSSSEAIKKLLDERNTVTGWLDRLSKAGDDTPDAVRTKVREDYEQRLEAVAKQLCGFTGELQGALKQQKKKHIELFDKETAAETRLAEAKLRHSVGELDDQQWNETRSEIEAELESAREERTGVGEELARLEEVLAAIGDLPDADDGADEDDATEEESAPDLAPTPTKKQAATPKSARKQVRKGRRGSKSFDEMEFLQSLGDGKSQGQGQKRRAGASFKPAAGQTSDPPSPASSDERSSPEPGTQHPASRKTLKCAGCGALNVPTEWYCENCGAELATE